ncbi:galactose-1-phosphate uridyl transferase [Microbotryomycetes sp. JL221]|nr:galactose-1-phosphate uridyl transferase [Microbotryomycetes sp. JL221]
MSSSIVGQIQDHDETVVIEFDPTSHSHIRVNPLTGENVLCSPHRTKRPWQGAVEPPQLDQRPRYDSKCYLCPGNERAGGIKTEEYDGTFIFENDFAALVEQKTLNPSTLTNNETKSIDVLFQQESTNGKCFVICFNPRHDLTVAEMNDQEIENIVNAWTKLYIDVSNQYSFVSYIQIFENKGSMMGCSNPHPHGQAWSLSHVPTIPLTMFQKQLQYALTQETIPNIPTLTNGLPCLLLTYVQTELDKHHKGDKDDRVVIVGSDFIVLVPFWAKWPFETMIVPYNEKQDLAHVIGCITRRMDNLFECSFAYSMGLYQASKYVQDFDLTTVSTKQDDAVKDGALVSQLHLGFYPPLLRSSTVKKFLVGFELFAEAQRDITPEQAAQRLRDCHDQHYKQRLNTNAE